MANCRLDALARCRGAQHAARLDELDDVRQPLPRLEVREDERPLAAPFEPEAGAYAGGHHHHSGDAKHSGIIHDMIELTRKRA